MGRLLPLLTCLAVFVFLVTPAHGYGYMNTLSTLWGGNPSLKSFSVCSIEESTGFPRCWGSFSVSNSSRPPANVSLWSLTGGAYFSCGLLEKYHTPMCWGQTPGSVVPSAFQNVSYSSINCGGWHVCAIREKTSNPKDEGRVDCWGDNNFQQCNAPPTIPIVSITAGDYFTCGLTYYSHRVVCWGQISSNDDSSHKSNQQGVYQALSAGRTHVCGITMDTRQARCWGSNEHGQSSAPTNISFSAIAAGMYHTCGIRLDNHAVICWGDDSLGQTDAPTEVAFSLITAGDRYTCGVRMDGMGVNCWGNEVAVPSLNFNTSQGVCVSECGQNEFGQKQFELSDRSTTLTGQCKICAACAQCANGTYEASACSPTEDTVCTDCGSCSFRPKDRCTSVCVQEIENDGDEPDIGNAKAPNARSSPPSSHKAPKSSASASPAATGFSICMMVGLCIVASRISL